MKKYLIIGSSAAGLTAANNLAINNPDSQVICLSAQNNLPYNKCLLTDFVTGKKNLNDLFLPISEKVKIVCDRAISLDVKSSTVQTKTSVFEYDKLLIATGSSTYVPDFYKNILHCKNVFLFNSLDDAINLKNHFQNFSSSNVVVIGGGITGLEIANVLRQKNFNVTIIEKNQIVRLLHEKLAAKLKSILNDARIKILEDTQIQDFVINNDYLKKIILNNEILNIDILILTTGTKPNTQWLENSPIQLQNGYVVTDSNLKTSIENIFAAGDCALVNNMINNEKIINNLWPDAVKQGFVASNNMLEKNTIYPGIFPNIVTNLNSKEITISGMCDNSKKFIELNSKDNYQAFFANQNDVVTGYFSVGNNQKNIAKVRDLILQQKENWQELC
ncbi:FAD-dependent oxidoreductase [Candidatus Dependentiae bacterium]|nr:FAD-dependent oxidoreductase [Candidatus Dependentiae bacterium]